MQGHGTQKVRTTRIQGSHQRIASHTIDRDITESVVVADAKTRAGAGDRDTKSVTESVGVVDAKGLINCRIEGQRICQVIGTSSSLRKEGAL